MRLQWKGRWGALIVVVSVSLLAAFAVPARADDASLARAWHSNDAALGVLNRQIASAFATFQRSNRVGRLQGLLARHRAVILRTRRAVLAQQPSTPTGAAARNSALRTLGLSVRRTLADQAGLRAFMRGHRALAARLFARAETLYRYILRAERQTDALLAQAGV
jgi:hypothetical protein